MESKIHKVVSSGPTKSSNGHEIAIKLEIESGDEPLYLIMDHVRLPVFLRAIYEGGVVAERARQALPGSEISTMVPYTATNANAGPSTDGLGVVAVFSTAQLAPIQIELKSHIAREAIARLSAALADLGKQLPKTPS